MTQPGPRTCDLPSCHARVTGRGRWYCCKDHSDKGRNLANIKERAASAERQVLRDALDGKTSPPAHVGFLATTRETVLNGQALVELRAVLSVLRSAAAPADAAPRRPDQAAPVRRPAPRCPRRSRTRRSRSREGAAPGLTRLATADPLTWDLNPADTRPQR